MNDMQNETTMPTFAMSEEQLLDEINLFRAERLAQNMLMRGLISSEECAGIKRECRKIFVPYLSEIL